MVDMKIMKSDKWSIMQTVDKEKKFREATFVQWKAGKTIWKNFEAVELPCTWDNQIAFPLIKQENFKAQSSTAYFSLPVAEQTTMVSEAKMMLRRPKDITSISVTSTNLCAWITYKTIWNSPYSFLSRCAMIHLVQMKSYSNPCSLKSSHGRHFIRNRFSYNRTTWRKCIKPKLK